MRVSLGQILLLLAIDISGYDLILGWPWLNSVNPDVNWEGGIGNIVGW
jgi:hypothetical protein